MLVGYFGCSGHLCDICFFARYVNKSEFSDCIVVFFIGSRICYLFCQCLCTFTHLYNLQKKSLNLPGMLKQMNRSQSLALHRPHPKHPRTKSLLTLRRTSQLQMKLNTVGLWIKQWSFHFQKSHLLYRWTFFSTWMCIWRKNNLDN